MDGKTKVESKKCLLGIIRPITSAELADDLRRPVVFIWGTAPDDPPVGIWILQPPELGLGPPQLTHEGIVDLLKKLVKTGFYDEDELIDALRSTKIT